MTKDRSGLSLEVRRLSPPDAQIYRDLRLESLQTHPEAFGASWEEEAAQPLPWFEDRLERNAIFGAQHPASSKLNGIAALHLPDTAKQRHKGVLWGMFVRPDARGTGLAPSLLAHVLQQALQAVNEVRLTVVATNTPAIRLYERVGFKQYGLEPRALKIGHDFHDELLMALSYPDLTNSASPPPPKSDRGRPARPPSPPRCPARTPPFNQHPQNP